ncbi:MAG: hypothetical protein CM15mP38_0070 [Synechococcus sp.]|nr:MAG: hypothetical protein CM15mP38_0070 [Synechococcus sp.]
MTLLSFVFGLLMVFVIPPVGIVLGLLGIAELAWHPQMSPLLLLLSLVLAVISPYGVTSEP